MQECDCKVMELKSYATHQYRTIRNDTQSELYEAVFRW